MSEGWRKDSEETLTNKIAVMMTNAEFLELKEFAKSQGKSRGEIIRSAVRLYTGGVKMTNAELLELKEFAKSQGKTRGEIIRTALRLYAADVNKS